MKLEIDSKKVLELAMECPEWKKGFEKLFPEIFEKEKKEVLNTDDFKIYNSNDYPNGVYIDYKGSIIGWFIPQDNTKTCPKTANMLRRKLLFIPNIIW